MLLMLMMLHAIDVNDASNFTSGSSSSNSPGYQISQHFVGSVHESKGMPFLLVSSVSAIRLGRELVIVFI